LYIYSMKKIIALLFIAVLFFSCSSDEVKSSENYIEKFSLPQEIAPVQINIINEQNLVYVLTNSDNYEKLSTVEPIVEPSKGASITKEGENWTEENFKYVITAENGEIRKYSVRISKTVPNKNSFEDWTSDKGYYVLSDLNWTSGNAGISTAFSMMKELPKDYNKEPENYPTKKTAYGYEGSAVVMETIEGGTVYGKNMPILSGNFFLGNFNTGKMADPLAATEFGKLYLAKPKSITGYYKYEEGNGTFIVDSNKNDSCDIYAALYRAKDDSGEEITLTAKDELDKSPYVLAYARWPDCSETEGDWFHPFVLNLDTYKSEPDFEKYSYKLIITFAASRGGATYKGKIGSKLIVDEVEIENY